MTQAMTEHMDHVEQFPHRSRLRWWVALGVATAVAAAGVGIAAWSRGGDDELFPRLSPEGSFRLAPMAAGQSEFSIATPRIEAPGKEIQILSVDALHSDNVEYLGALAVWPRDIKDTLVTGGPGFPMPDLQPKHHPIDQVIPASETLYKPPGWSKVPPVQIIVGFRLLSGVGATNGVTVTYKVDGEKKREHFRYAVVGCIKPDPCGDDDPDFNSKVLRQFGLIKD